ncbi:hypothetical protein VTI74DRAFT_4853 [Chaetomium olivicolor]
MKQLNGPACGQPFLSRRDARFRVGEEFAPSGPMRFLLRMFLLRENTHQGWCHPGVTALGVMFRHQGHVLPASRQCQRPFNTRLPMHLLNDVIYPSRPYLRLSCTIWSILKGADLALQINLFPLQLGKAAKLPSISNKTPTCYKLWSLWRNLRNSVQGVY